MFFLFYFTIIELYCYNTTKQKLVSEVSVINISFRYNIWENFIVPGMLWISLELFRLGSCCKVVRKSPLEFLKVWIKGFRITYNLYPASRNSPIVCRRYQSTQQYTHYAYSLTRGNCTSWYIGSNGAAAPWQMCVTQPDTPTDIVWVYTILPWKHPRFVPSRPLPYPTSPRPSAFRRQGARETLWFPVRPSALQPR